MRKAALTVMIGFLAPALLADVAFDPPNPDSRSPVYAVVNDSINGCTALSGRATRVGNEIRVTISSVCGILPAFFPFIMKVDLGVLPVGVHRVRTGLEQFNQSFGEATLIVQDANPPFTVTPNVSLYMDFVTLVGHNIASCSDTPICLPPVVRFRNEVARVHEIRPPNQIVVVTPGLQPGPADVTVEMGNQTFRNPLGFYYPTLGSRPGHEFFESILLPVVFAGQGAFGSQWDTEVAMRNENEYPLTTPLPTLFDNICMPFCEMRPLGRSTLTRTGRTYANGHLIYVPRQAAPNLHFGTLVKDLSRQSQALGTEIPVVREKNLYGRPFQLLDVPADSRYRVTLRIYDVEAPRGVVLTIKRMNSSTELITVIIPLSGTPAYNVINDLIDQFPSLAGQGPLRIEIAPLSPTETRPSLWGFVSITNNTTQHVTVISPQ